MSYQKLANFAPDIDNSYSRDPLYYCTLDPLDSQFMHGTMGRTEGRYNSHCSTYLAHYCAAQWDDVCDAISEDPETRFPNTNLDISVLTDTPRGSQNQALDPIPYGEQMTINAAQKKYRISTTNCNIRCEPFDPTVPNSPLVCYESSAPCPIKGSAGTTEYCFGAQASAPCIREYGLTEAQARDIQNDRLMNRLLDRPKNAMQILLQIYFGARKLDTLKYLNGTRLGAFYNYLGYPLETDKSPYKEHPNLFPTSSQAALYTPAYHNFSNRR